MSQEPEQDRAGQRGNGHADGNDAGSSQMPVGGPGSGGTAGPENTSAAGHPAAPERPRYNPPSYVPPVEADKDANATEPIPSYPTRPIPRDLPPGAPPLPGRAGPGAGQGQQESAQQARGAASASSPQSATPGPPQLPQPQPGPPQPHGYPGYPAGSTPGRPTGYAGQPQPPGQQHPGPPAQQHPGYLGQQHPGHPGQHPSAAQFPGAAQPYSGQPYLPQGYPQQPYAQGYPGYPPAQAYGQPLYYAPMAEPKGLSIAAMICGIAVYAGFGFLILPQIAAVVLGHMGLAREPGGRGFAIAGLVMGYIGIALTLAFLAFFVVFASSLNQSPY
ncbi:DUF4190 domain-containing protein [Sinomonas mesophila]|uniref:DUF4190 domain-containing protein n=1 Tax=Sinomonas mesophila TaxID=1531955 RepID=UPI001FE4F6EE|nr:DUF4190 domain-containing protein [Sinomonas mesophila]